MTRLLDKTGAEIEMALDVLPYVPTVKATRSTVQPIPGGGVMTAIAFDVERWDTDNVHDTVVNNTRFVCNRAGKYFVKAMIAWGVTFTGQGEIRIYKNGGPGVGVPVVVGDATLNWNGANPSFDYVLRAIDIVDLAVNDFLEVYVLNTSGGAANVEPNWVAGGIDSVSFEWALLGPALYAPVRQKPVVWQGSPSSMPVGPFQRYDVLELTVTDPNDSTKQVIWELVYRDDLDAVRPWHFKGGTELSHEVTTAETTSSAAYADLATIGPTLVIPRTGVYAMTIGASIYSASGAGQGQSALKIGAAVISDFEGIFNITSPAGPGVSVSRTFDRAATIGDVLKMQYRIVGGTSGGFHMRHLRIRPVKIG
jgi:hypothetical protein